MVRRVGVGYCPVMLTLSGRLGYVIGYKIQDEIS